MSRRRLPVLLLSTATLAALAVPAVGVGASAPSRDRDHDRMPDRWERVHGLKVARDDARRDRDRDGLKNLAEYRAGLDPRDRDSDDDGVLDGAEEAGVVASYTGGVLVIRTFDGDVLRGRVTSNTDIECDDDAPATSRSSSGEDGERDETGTPEVDDHHDDDDDPRVETDDHHDDDADPRVETDDHRDDDADTHDEREDDCGPAALVVGARVEEAKLSVTRNGRVWFSVELQR